MTKRIRRLAMTGIFWVACSHPTIPIGGECKTTSQCGSGLFCSSGKCGSAPGGAATGAPTLTGLTQKSDGSFTLTGTHLDTVKSATVSTGGGAATPLTIAVGATATSLSVTTALSLVAGTVYDFVVTNADAASSPLQVTFTLPANAVTSDGVGGTALAAALSPLLIVKRATFSADFNGEEDSTKQYYCKTVNDSGDTTHYVPGSGGDSSKHCDGTVATGALPNANFSQVAFVGCDVGYTPVSGGCQCSEGDFVNKNCLATPDDCYAPASGTPLNGPSPISGSTKAGWGCRAIQNNQSGIAIVTVTVSCLKVQ